MIQENSLTDKARELMDRLDREAEASGYHLNPDREVVLSLCEGLLTNLQEHGYMGCPCRLLEGEKFEDLDAICPCDYRDRDLSEFGFCYCALYVTREVLEGKKEPEPIPERRPTPLQVKQIAKKRRSDPASVGIKVWRCKVCGYLCAREIPPEECPVCKAKKDRFETFNWTAA